MKCFKVAKSRKEHRCSNCKKVIPSKSYLYASDWISLCLDCGEEFSHKAIEGYKEIIKYIKDNQKKFKANKDEWETQNTLTKL